ncbi:protein wntless [Anthonomus grandis grandis]|uniref:protein wntless n=1 Tax=Anthonomus grandis grandis TaxID=2921223 RepID=UPI002165E2DE|nr:protein wntless [Anthonomus grandis grandis]
MPGTILENLSGRKLSVLVTILLLSQLACFLVGLISPSPASSQGILSTICVDKNPKVDNFTKWFSRQCAYKVDLSHPESTKSLQAKELVFVVEMPLYEQDFSRWQQSLVGVLQIDMVYKKGQNLINKMMELTFDARLAVSDKLEGGGKSAWTYYTHAITKRYMDCIFNDTTIKNMEGYPYNCTMVPLFELGSLYHDYYLLNLRLPYDDAQELNTQLLKIEDIYLHTIHMNGGFTKVWVSLKTIFFPIIVGIMIWFWRRVHILARTPALLEYMLICLGGALAFLDLPLEYLTLFFDMPYMLFLSDIRQGIFYAMLLSFWLVFTGEHMLIQESGDRNSLKKYWKHLSSIGVGCVSLLIFDLCERGMHLVNPFYSVWISPLGTNLALSFVICGGLCAGIYFIFLCYMVWRVFKNISIKRSVLPSMTQARRLHYEGIMYRFTFLMGATLVCAGVTVVSFLLNQYNQGEHHWDDSMDIEWTSVVHTGVYGMWNIYICALLMLYAPSHKQWPSEPQCTEGEEVEFSRLSSETTTTPNEISSLTSFVAKANIE